MDNIMSVLAISVVVEGLVSYAKMFVVERKIEWQNVVAVVLGVAFAVAYSIDVFALLGMNSAIPFFGSVMSGVLMSRGANYIFDTLKTIRSYGKSESGETEEKSE